jgi:hypothetical protein
MITMFCGVVLSVIQGVALNMGVLSFSKGRAPQLMRVNSANVLDEGIMIGERGHRMNSKVGFQTNKANIVY